MQRNIMKLYFSLIVIFENNNLIATLPFSIFSLNVCNGNFEIIFFPETDTIFPLEFSFSPPHNFFSVSAVTPFGLGIRKGRKGTLKINQTNLESARDVVYILLDQSASIIRRGH